MRLSPCVGLIALFTLLSLGCTSLKQQPPTIPKITAAAKQPSASVPIRDVMHLTRRADLQGAAARAKLDIARSELEDYRGKIITFGEMVQKLQKKGSASARDLKALFDEVSTQGAIIERLVDRLKDVQVDFSSEQRLRKGAEESLVIASQLVASKDVEAGQLRSQMEDKDGFITELEDNAEHNFTVAEEAATDRDLAIGARNLLAKALTTVGFVLFLSILLNWLQFKGIF